MYYVSNRSLTDILYNKPPQALALINGSQAFPEIHGTIKFYTVSDTSLLIEAEIQNLPEPPGESSAFFGFHIHENGDCRNDFANTGSHYNPAEKTHPFHAGDLLPLLSNHGYAWMSFYDSRLTIQEIIGKSAIIHQHADDFKTQPSGDSGNKIACGVIMPRQAGGCL